MKQSKKVRRNVKDRAKAESRQRKFYNQKVSRAEMYNVLQQLETKLVAMSGFVESKFPGEFGSYIEQMQSAAEEEQRSRDIPEIEVTAAE